MKISKALGIATTSAVGLGGGTWGAVDFVKKRNAEEVRRSKKKFFATGR